MVKDVKRTQNYNTQTYMEELELLIPFAEVTPFMQIVLDSTVKNAVAPGFRKGHVPKEKILQERNPEIFDKAVNLLVDETIKQIFDDLNPRPAAPIRITKIEPVADEKGEAIIELKVIIEYIPVPVTEVDTKNLTGININKEAVIEPTSEDVEAEIANIWFNYSSTKNPELKKEDYKKELITQEFLTESKITENVAEIIDYDSLEAYLRKAMLSDRANQTEMKYIDEVVSYLVDKAKIEKYEGLREKEVETRYANYLSKFKQLGADPEKYLKDANVDTDQLKAEWRQSIEAELKAEFILIAYANADGFTPSPEAIQERIDRMDQNTKNYYNKFEIALKVIAEIELKKTYILDKVTGKDKK